ncbi:MAG TPA: class I SAM-dependent methyltransferase [Chlamydiales bacterium]|nr:class I SAM-dependent methyltransferase [Chlamydiales bacterium]
MSTLISSVSSKTQFWLYRLTVILKSLKTLYTLPPAKVDAFLDSYVIYDHDWADEERLIAELGHDYQKVMQKKIVDYYSVLNHLCSVGQVEKMYIPPAMDLSASIITNQKLFEKMMCEDLGLARSQKVLDLGCGRGRVASHMAQMSGAHVTGMNIDNDQLQQARKFAAGNGLSKKVEFVQGDVNQIPYAFPDASFDNVYQIQCLFSLAKDLGKTFKEIHRLLKPGGKFGSLDWVSLSAYDAKNPHHADLMKRVKPLIGAIGTHSIENCIRLLEDAGFEILKNENASIDGLQAPLIQNADKFFTRVTKLIHYCVRYKILPAHFKPLFDRLVKDGEAFVEADRMRLFTTSHYIVARKK